MLIIKKKNKLIIIAAVFCSALFGILIIFRITGMLQYFITPTPANEPNIKQGDKVFASNLKTPMPYDFVVVTSEYADSVNMIFMPDFKAGSHYLYRLCGLPDDVIEMKNGILYVNDKNFDKKLNLNNQYKIGSTEFNLIEQVDIETMNKSGGGNMISRDSALVVFDSVLLNKYSSQIKPVLYIMPNAAYGSFKWNNKSDYWTPDNFGPLKVPHDCYFVLGDNRHNAMDSRYTGFVKKQNIKGVALNK